MQVEVENGIQGPPQAVAITPDASVALVGAPTRYDPAAKKLLMDSFVQVVDLQASPPAVSRLDIGSHPQGIAIDRAGHLALVACVDGSVVVLGIEGNRVTLVDTLKIAQKRLAGVSFTHDGRHALVALRDEQGVAVLNVADGHVTDSGVRLSSGVAPYTIDVSSDGKWAVVSDVGLAGLPSYAGKLAGDADTVTLIDVSHEPFRAVQHVTVPSLPEGVAISADGKWIGVQAMDGSNLTPDNPGRNARGKVLLFAIRDGQAVKVSEAPGGEAAQGIVFTADSKYLIVQFNVEKAACVVRRERRASARYRTKDRADRRTVVASHDPALSAPTIEKGKRACKRSNTARKNVVVFRQIPDDLLERIRASHDVVVADPRRAEELPRFREALHDADGLIGSSFKLGAEELARSPRLRGDFEHFGRRR